MKNLRILLVSLPLAAVCLSCNTQKGSLEPEVPVPEEKKTFTLETVAKMLSELPIGEDQLSEVFGAVNSSSSEGYDEEYTMTQLFENPGAGTGGGKSSLGKGVPLRDMIADYLAQKHPSSKSGASDVEAMLEELSESGMQIYWPFSEDWDGKTFPLITFDPGYGVETNYAYEVSYTGDGYRVVDSVFVDEAVAMDRPVWVVNNNSDEGYVPLSPIDLGKGSVSGGSSLKSLYLKSIKAMRNYDSWFAGASEFFIKCGSVGSIKEASEEDMKKFYPQLNDMMIVVKRKDVGREVVINSLLVSSIPDEADKLAFLMIEDDGGKNTSWKCAATVKYESKSYGFDLDIPYRNNDDIVWRGQLGAEYFRQQDPVTGRFGDVCLTFSLR